MDYLSTQSTSISPGNERADGMRESGSISYEDSQVPLNSEATTAITENNSSTPLLRTPLEIRNQIYELLCGGQLLHIDLYCANGECNITHRVCGAEISEQAAEDRFHAETTDPWFVTAIEDRHEDCSRYNKHAEKISTQFLATCRQVYDEARHFPYTTNIFGFDNTQTMHAFTSPLRNSGFGSHLEIRRVHLDMCEYGYERSWAGITHYLLQSLPEVRRISINWRQRYPCVYGPRRPAEFEARQPQESTNSLMSSFLELGELQLTRFNLVISDNDLCGFGYHTIPIDGKTLPRWTLAEKQAWARYIKNSVLRKDNQLATSSGLAVETPKRDVKFGEKNLFGG